MNRLRRVIALICALTILAGCLGIAFADTNDYAYVKNTKAKIYKTSTMGSRLCYIYKYEIVKIEAVSSNRAKVSYGSKTGYMYLSDLTQVNPLNKEATLCRSAYVYAKPATSSSRRAISKSTKVNVLAVNGNWAIVEKSGSVGYLQIACLTEYTPSTANASSYKSYSLSGSVTECRIEAEVNTSSLTVYLSASTSASKLGTVKKGTRLNVFAYNATWAYVEYNGSYGYCKHKYLKKISEETAASASSVPSSGMDSSFTACDPCEATVNVSKCKVYSGPSASGTYLGYVGKGSKITLLGSNGAWAYVTLNGKYGYAKLSELTYPKTEGKPVASAAPTPAPAQTPAPEPEYPASTDPVFTNSSTTNAQKIYQYFTTETSYNEAVACGILASIAQESGCSPTSGKGKSYQGLCQWSSSRFSILESWCNSNGYDPYSLEGQCKFLYYDLSQRYTLYHKNLLAIANTSEGAYDAGYYFCYYYERPASLESSSAKRGALARDTYWPKYAH